MATHETNSVRNTEVATQDSMPLIVPDSHFRVPLIVPDSLFRVPLIVPDSLFYVPH